jgi:hypothetical protein
MDKTTVSLRQYFNLYELALSYEGKTPKTLDIYLRNLNRFERHLAGEFQREPNLADFTPDAVMAFIMALKTGQRYQAPLQDAIEPAHQRRHPRPARAHLERLRHLAAREAPYPHELAAGSAPTQTTATYYRAAHR